LFYLLKQLNISADELNIGPFIGGNTSIRNWHIF
jgi:hypothetical protein